MRKKELIHLLDERQQRVDYLMKRVESMEDLIKGYREREQSVVDAMASAHRTADDYMAEAVRRAESILKSAREEADQTVSSARDEACAIKKNAETQSAELLKHAEATVAEYESTVHAYNEAIEASAAETLKQVNRYVEILKAGKLPSSELLAEVSGMSKIPLQEEVVLPDTEGDPAKLMKNIYQLQNRDLPEMGEQCAESQAPPEAEAEQPSFSSDEDDVAKSIDLGSQFGGETGGEVPVYTYAEASGEDRMQPAPDEVPKVGQFVEENGDEDALSLDDLLDEIIQAGDKINNG